MMPSAVEMVSEGVLRDDPQHEDGSGGVAAVVAFRLNISARPSVPLGVLDPLDDGPGECKRSRLGWQHLQGPPVRQ